MTQKLLTLPVRVGFGAVRLTFGITTRIVETAIDIARPGSRRAPSPAPGGRPAPPARPSQTTQHQAATHVNGGPAAPAAPAPSTQPPATELRPAATPTAVTPPAEQPDTPLSPAEDAVKTLDDRDEVIATFAEPGAEDGAGAQLQVAEPWDGYDGMNASKVVARLNQAAAAELAMVELYEASHKNRRTVLDAAARRLRDLSPPDIA